MAHVNGGYIITTRSENVEKATPITQDTLKKIADILNVKDVKDIRTIVVYGAAGG